MTLIINNQFQRGVGGAELSQNFEVGGLNNIVGIGG